MKKTITILAAILMCALCFTAAAEGTKAADFTKVGNIVTFGRYEQDSDAGNGPEPVEWIVLDVKDGKALLISQYGLDSQPFEEEFTGITWAECSLRTWLEETFLPAAFTAEEQAAILLTDVDNSKAQGSQYSTVSDGEDTQDRLFLLSCKEFDQYANTIWLNTHSTKAGVILTSYAGERGAEQNDRYYIPDGPFMIFPGWWWLRSPGQYRNQASVVWADGWVQDMYVNSTGGCVRPAFWLDLSKLGQ